MRGYRRVAAVLLVTVTLSCERAPSSEPLAPPPPADSGRNPEPCRSASTQTELTSCWSAESRLAEQGARGAFDRAANLLRNRPDAESLRALEQAESAWAAYRTAQCAATAAPYRGGSLGPMQQARCRAERANERRLTLERFAADLTR